MAHDRRCNLRPITYKLACDENGEMSADLLEARIVELQMNAASGQNSKPVTSNEVRETVNSLLDEKFGSLTKLQNKNADAIRTTLGSNLLALHEAVTIMQSLLISSVAGIDNELDFAMETLMQRSAELQLKAAEETDLKEAGLRNFLRRTFEDREMAKSPIPEEKQVEKEDDEIERD